MWRRPARLASCARQWGPGLSTSASTPRLRVTLAWYVALLAATALNAPGLLASAGGAAGIVIATALVGTSVLGRIWCSAFIAGRKDAQLVAQGPYAACRHPLYALSLVGGAGLGIATGSLVLAGATLLLLGVLFTRAIRAEDALLGRMHGAAFEAYRRTTPALWPDLSRCGVPERLEIGPRVFWKAFVDGASVLLLLALLLGLAAWRQSTLVPALLHLP
jgi:protein-S-isoprenylcysteine O-methyltransferase Ste14